MIGHTSSAIALISKQEEQRQLSRHSPVWNQHTTVCKPMQFLQVPLVDIEGGPRSRARARREACHAGISEIGSGQWLAALLFLRESARRTDVLHDSQSDLGTCRTEESRQLTLCATYLEATHPAASPRLAKTYCKPRYTHELVCTKGRNCNFLSFGLAPKKQGQTAKKMRFVEDRAPPGLIGEGAIRSRSWCALQCLKLTLNPGPLAYKLAP